VRIKEKFSEKPQPKRGRPRTFPDYHEKLADAIPSDANLTERSLRNNRYFFHALCVLQGAENPKRFLYLLPAAEQIKNGKEKIRRHSILAELGHLDEADLLEWATIICRKKWPTKECIRRLRNWRLGREQFPPGDVDNLTRHLLKALNTYWAEHSADDDHGSQVTQDALHILELAMILQKENNDGTDKRNET
jgi:hypothetical protein